MLMQLTYNYCICKSTIRHAVKIPAVMRHKARNITEEPNKFKPVSWGCSQTSAVVIITAGNLLNCSRFQKMMARIGETSETILASLSERIKPVNLAKETKAELAKTEGRVREMFTQTEKNDVDEKPDDAKETLPSSKEDDSYESYRPQVKPKVPKQNTQLKLK